MATKVKANEAGTAQVDGYMAQLAHPFKSEMQALRALVLAVDPRIDESIKWNAPSFSLREHFATFQPRARDGVQLILHLGAKQKRESGIRNGIADPTGLLQWLGPDRASVKLSSVRAIEENADALVAVLRQWIGYL